MNQEASTKNPPLNPWWGIYIIIILGFPLFFFLKPKPPPLPNYGSSPRFSLTDQLERTVSSESFLGKPSVVNFIFTRCEHICPAITSSMASLQTPLKKADVQMITFSVDPEYDKPAVLKEYASNYDADHETWRFLTGSIEGVNIISTGYQQAYSRNPDQEGTPDITHSQKMILVDATGDIRGFFDDNAKGQAALLNGIERL